MLQKNVQVNRKILATPTVQYTIWMYSIHVYDTTLYTACVSYKYLTDFPLLRFTSLTICFFLSYPCQMPHPLTDHNYKILIEEFQQILSFLLCIFILNAHRGSYIYIVTVNNKYYYSRHKNNCLKI